MADEGFIIFNRPPRIQRALPEDSVEIPKPPEPQFKGDKLSVLVLILPILLAILTLGAMVTATLLRAGTNMIFLLTMGVASLGMIMTSTVTVLVKITGDRANRKEYAELLDERESQLRDYSRQQQTILNYLYPTLSQIIEWPREQQLRLWERRINDADYLRIRLGIGSRPSTVSVNAVKSEKKLPMLDRALKISTSYQEVPEVPDFADLYELTSLGIVGSPDEAIPFVRSIICQLAAHHSPEDVKVLATYPPSRSDEWYWLGWLPHARISDNKGNEIPMVASHSDQLEMIGNFVLDTIKRRDNRRHESSKATAMTGNRDTKKPGYKFPNLIWVVDDFELVQDEAAIKKLFEMGTDLGVFIIATTSDLSKIPTQCRAIAEMLPNGRVRYSISGEDGRITSLWPDLATKAYCEEFALAMTPLKLKTASEKGELGGSLRLLDILGISPDPNNIFDPLTIWNRSAVGTLKVPVGLVFGGQELFLDISDKGHGPHGLIAGTTGSGKSELLLTVVSALALTNHPDNLNFILGDFKGGATFNPFINLPHVVGMMSDLDLTIVERAMTAIFSELKRREHLLKEEGVTHIRDYQKKKPRPKTPMPYLLVIIDEFAEMKEQAPDFMDKVINIARTGRTLGVHLILATQRPAGVVTGQLNSNTKFRLCLRVETPEDSNDMLGRKDAAMIASNLPGRAFFKVGSDIFEQFQVARVAIPFDPTDDQAQKDEPLATLLDDHWRAMPLSADKYARRMQLKPVEKEGVEMMDYDVISAQCAAAAKRTVIRNTHKPWLDPMGSCYYLANYMDGKGFEMQNPNWPDVPPFGYGRAPLAMLDNVVDQVQGTYFMDLTAHGSYCISGLKISGKTNVLRTMVTSLALTHAPDDMRFFILDMANTLKPLANLPHPTNYIPMAEQAQLKPVFKELYEELQNRKAKFANRGVLDLTSYRKVVGSAEKLPAIFIAFDNFASIRHNPPFEIEHLKAIVREGNAYGIHVAITMDRANDFEYGRLAEQFLQIALRQVREDVTFNIPKNMIGSWNGIPGRGFIKGSHNRPPLEVQVFLPCTVEPEKQMNALEDLVAKMQAAASKIPRWAKLNGGALPADSGTVAPQAEPEKEKAKPEEKKEALNTRREGYWASLFAKPADDKKEEPVAPEKKEEPKPEEKREALNTRREGYWAALFAKPAEDKKDDPVIQEKEAVATEEPEAQAQESPTVANNNGKSVKGNGKRLRL